MSRIVIATLEDLAVVAELKARFAPDGGAEREHNADVDSAGFASIHYALVRNLRPERALVIGSRYGYIPAVIALALKASGQGQLDFVDANYSDEADGFEFACGGVGHWGGDAETVFRDMNLGDFITTHVMTANEFFARCQERYGYVYLDGNHTYEACREDLVNALEVAVPGAVIAMHDVVVMDPPFGVHRVFAELGTLGCVGILVDAWPGLGIVQVQQGGGAE